MAPFTVWEGPMEATGADIAARPGHTLHADAVAADFVTLWLQDPTRIAVACMTLKFRVTPEQLSALVTSSSSKTRMAGALTTDLVAGRPVRVLGVAVAALTAVAAGHVPGVRRAAVTVLTDHVGSAETLTATAVAVTVGGGLTAGFTAAQRITDTLPAVLNQGVAVVTQLAVLARGTLAMVETAQTLAGSDVTGLRVQHVNVVIALAWETLATCLLRVSIVTR